LRQSCGWWLTIAVIFAAVLSAGGCKSDDSAAQAAQAEREKRAAEDWCRDMADYKQRMLVLHGNAGVTHVVLCWLNDPGDATARQKLIDASHRFAKIPGVVTISAGPPLGPSTRPNVDSSFDLAIVITFESEAALRGYDQHPIHR
jgi:hypothetical protein